jgi:hypothetical protein
LQLPIRRGWAEEELKKESGKGEMSSRKKREKSQKELNFCRGGRGSPGAVAQILENSTKRNGFACETSKVFGEGRKMMLCTARARKASNIKSAIIGSLYTGDGGVEKIKFKMQKYC